MLVVSQNKLKLVDVNQLILHISGTPTNQEVSIKELDSPVVLATYYNKQTALNVFKQFIDARKRIYKLEHAPELLSENEKTLIIQNDYCFTFPEETHNHGVSGD